MADLQRTIEITFGAIDKTGSALSSVSKNVNGAVDSISGLTAPLAAIGNDILKTELAITALGVAFLSVAVNESTQFTNQMREIGSLVNATPKDIDRLKGSVQDFAAVSTSDFNQIAQAVYTATSNIGDSSKALDILTVAEKGAVVGVTSLDNSAALLTRTMNAYGLIVGDSAENTANAERIMAAMFATVQSGDTNMALLADNIGRVTSTAAAANVPIEIVGASLAALTGAGINTAESVTLLNALLKELLNPGKELAPVLGNASIATDGLQKVMELLKTSTGGSADQMFRIFSSSEAAKGALILANDSAGKFSGTISAMATATENFNKNYENLANGVSQSNQRLENNFKILLQNIGGPLESGWSDILDSLTLITQGFTLNISDGTFDPIFTALSDFEDDISNFLRQIGENLPDAIGQVDFSNLLRTLDELGIRFSDLFDDVDLATPEGLARAIQFVVDSSESLISITTGIVESWGPFLRKLLEGIDAFNKLDSATKESTGNLLGYSQIFETLKGAVTTGTTALDLMGKSLAVIAGIKTAESIVALSASLGPTGLYGAAVAAAGAIGYGAGASLASGIDSVLSKITGSETTLGAWVYDITHSGEESLVASTKIKTLGDAFAKVSDETEAVVPSIKNYDSEVAAAADANWSFSDAVNGVAASLNLVDRAASDVVGSFGSLAEAEAAALLEIDKGKTTAITFADGMYQLHSNNQKVVESTKEVTAAVEDTSKAMIRGSAEWKRVQEVMLETQKQADDFKIKMQELANEKYEIQVKAAVDIQVAQIEADTQRIQSAMQATSEAIKSLTEASTDLWAEWSGASSWDKTELKQAAERMEDRLDAELELKRQLTEAIVAQSIATTQRLLSGEPIIQIDGSQLAPELEMIFDKILEYTQIRASNEGLNLLLGVGV